MVPCFGTEFPDQNRTALNAIFFWFNQRAWASKIWDHRPAVRPAPAWRGLAGPAHPPHQAGLAGWLRPLAGQPPSRPASWLQLGIGLASWSDCLALRLATPAGRPAGRAAW
jgi:hypothetical protein